MFSTWNNYVKRSYHEQLMEVIWKEADYVTAEDYEGIINNMCNYMSHCLSDEEILLLEPYNSGLGWFQRPVNIIVSGN